MFKRFGVPLLAGFALALACNMASAAKAKSADFTAADVAGRGLVLFSTSADRTSWSSGTALMLKRVVEKDGKTRLKQVDAFYVDNPTVKSHSPTEHMNVHWRALEPGDYILERQMVDPMACFSVFITYRFRVTAGTNVYLGEFHVQNGVPVVRDNYQRDYAYFSTNAGGEKPAAFTPALPVETTKDNDGCLKSFGS